VQTCALPYTTLFRSLHSRRPLAHFDAEDDLPPVAHDGEDEHVAHFHAVNGFQEVAAVVDGPAVDLDDDVPHPQAGPLGRRAGDDVQDDEDRQSTRLN